MSVRTSSGRAGEADEVARYAQELHRRGWVANHDGNVTVRTARGRFLATPSGVSKADVTSRNLIEVDESGAVLGGSGRAFGEMPMHLAVYRGRDDVGAVIHAHPPHATALACSGKNLIERPFIAEAVVSLGDRIPLLPYAHPGGPAADALAPWLGRVDAVLLENHGVFAWGARLEQAYLRLELVEHLARIAILAQATGGVRPFPEDALPPLLAARAKAGLGKAAEQAGHPEPRSRIADLVREELLRSLRQG